MSKINFTTQNENSWNVCLFDLSQLTEGGGKIKPKGIECSAVNDLPSVLDMVVRPFYKKTTTTKKNLSYRHVNWP